MDGQGPSPDAPSRGLRSPRRTNETGRWQGRRLTAACGRSAHHRKATEAQHAHPEQQEPEGPDDRSATHGRDEHHRSVVQIKATDAAILAKMHPERQTDITEGTATSAAPCRTEAHLEAQQVPRIAPGRDPDSLDLSDAIAARKRRKRRTSPANKPEGSCRRKSGDRHPSASASSSLTKCASASLAFSASRVASRSEGGGVLTVFPSKGG